MSNKRKNILFGIKVFALTALLTSCLGEIQQASKEVTESARTEYDESLRFDGLYEAVPVSNTKIEIYFPPAKGGSLRYSYLIYVGNQPDPLTVTEEVLSKDYRGMFRYTIQGLDIGTQYSIKVDVKDTETGEIKSSGISKAVYTFSNYVADFAGISRVENVQGVDGVDSLKVRWSHAAVPGGIFDNKDGPQTYEIILIDSSKLTPSAIDEEDLLPQDGRVAKYIEYDPLVTETVVRGLKEATTYYVAVRCVHEGSLIDPNQPFLKSEKNHKYIEARTLSQDASNIEYNAEEFLVQTNHGELANSSLLVQWGEFLGLLDHFRVYYAKTPHLNVDTSMCAAGGGSDLLSGSTFCKKAPTSSSGLTLTDLVSQTEYQAQLLACLDPSCSESVPLPIRTAKTSAPVASFAGIESLQLASDLADVGSVKLEFTPPDFTGGYFDGLALEYTIHKNDLQTYLNGEGPMPASHMVIEDESADHPLTHDRFDYQNDSAVIVRGLNYSEEKNYCFSLYPFNYDQTLPGGKKFYKENAVWKCEKVEIKAPTVLEFPGVASAYTVDNNLVVSWEAPSGGIYSHFEIFYRKASSSADLSFDFDQAILDTTVNFNNSVYERIFVSREGGIDGNGNLVVLAFYNIDNIAAGYYLVGMGTFYSAGIGQLKRSEQNQEIYQCYVSGLSNVVDCQKI